MRRTPSVVDDTRGGIRVDDLHVAPGNRGLAQPGASMLFCTPTLRVRERQVHDREFRGISRCAEVNDRCARLDPAGANIGRPLQPHDQQIRFGN
jgi:hypothetical protein